MLGFKEKTALKLDLNSVLRSVDCEGGIHMRETEQRYVERRIGLWGKYSVQLNISIR